MPSELRDDDLLRQAAQGDEAAFTHIYREHQALLYRFALRMSGSASVAEETVQEVFLAVLRGTGKFKITHGSLASYLFGIARNLVMKRLDRMRRDVPLETAEGEIDAQVSRAHAGNAAHTRTPEVQAEEKEMVRQVREAVLDLQPEFREAVVLIDLQEMSYEEAAQLLACPIGTIRSRLHRGRALLLDKLKAQRTPPQATTPGNG